MRVLIHPLKCWSLIWGEKCFQSLHIDWRSHKKFWFRQSYEAVMAAYEWGYLPMCIRGLPHQFENEIYHFGLLQEWHDQPENAFSNLKYRVSRLTSKNMIIVNCLTNRFECQSKKHSEATCHQALSNYQSQNPQRDTSWELEVCSLDFSG